MMRRILAIVVALIAIATPAVAQLSGPLLLDQNGSILSQRPYWQFLGGNGTTCASTTVAGKPVNQCSFTGSAPVTTTLQQAYTNGGAGGGTIALTSSGAGIIAQDNATPIATALFAVTDAVGLHTYFSVNASTGLTMCGGGGNACVLAGPVGGYIQMINAQFVPLFDANTQLGAANLRWTDVFTQVVDGGTSGALTLAAHAASTWSTSAGALSIESAAALGLGDTTATSINVGNGTIQTIVFGQLLNNASNAGGGNTSSYVPVIHGAAVNQAIEFGTVTAAAATTATKTFGTAFNATPVCVCVDTTNITTIKCLPTNSTTLVVTTSSASSDTFAYACEGAR